LLDLALRNSARFLFASTSEIYGDPQVSPQYEEYWGNVNPIGVRSIYDESKRLGETIVEHYFREKNANASIVRIFNTYGPRMALDDGRVVSNFIVQALRNDPITMYGDGSQTRSFCYVDDLVRGLESLLWTENDVAGPINIGNPGEFTILELAEIVIAMTNSKSEIVFSNLPSDDPKQRKPSIELAKNVLKWEPRIQLREGLAKSIPYFESALKRK
jgi:UDP-glucuronate decarboxylase